MSNLKKKNRQLTTTLEKVKERVGLVAKFVEPDFDITQLNGFSKSTIARIISNNELVSPARSRDGVEKSIQEAQTFLQIQGKILEEIFTIVSRVDEIKGFSDEMAGEPSDLEKWNDEFNSIKKLLSEDMEAEYNGYKIFEEDPEKQTIRVKGEDESRPVAVGRFSINNFLKNIIRCNNIQSLSPSNIRRASNFISELLGKNSAAKMDLRSRFKLLANSRDEEQHRDTMTLESHTTWLLQIFSYSDPLATQGNVNPEVTNQLIS